MIVKRFVGVRLLGGDEVFAPPIRTGRQYVPPMRNADTKKKRAFVFPSSSFFFPAPNTTAHNMKTATVWALLLALVIAVAALTSGASAGRNNARTAKRDAFVARLMASLTLKEKVGQMTQVLLLLICFFKNLFFTAAPLIEVFIHIYLLRCLGSSTNITIIHFIVGVHSWTSGCCRSTTARATCWRRSTRRLSSTASRTTASALTSTRTFSTPRNNTHVAQHVSGENRKQKHPIRFLVP
jgi:hypothetical protein